MKLDGRVKYTRRVLKEAFLKTMGEKPVNKITVKEICSRAELNRATFYTHYKDVYDLLSHIENELVYDIAASLGDTKNVPLQEVLCRIFAAVKKNADLCALLFSDHGDKEVLRRIIAMGREIGIKSWRDIIPSASEMELERLYTFFAHGSVAIIERWVQDGMQEDPAIPARFIASICHSCTCTFNSPL